MISYDRPANISAFQAISEAQKLAFAPIAFQASVALVRLGVLDAVAEAGADGIDAAAIAGQLELEPYGVGVLLDMGLSIGLVWLRDDRYVLDKVGHFLLNDRMTAVNMNFVADVCYKPMDCLQESVRQGKPRGLAQFGEWSTLYPGLTSLPEPARTSWFTFDQFYSGAAFPAALPIVFARPPRHIVDIGGNTGVWAAACVEHDPSVRVTIVDLPEQLQEARRQLEGSAHRARIDFWAADVLDPRQPLPADADAVWMSQFLDCFSEAQIAGILARVAGMLPPRAPVFILEILADRQQHAAAAYSVNATSLYFTCIANGVSRMYRSGDIERLAAAAGFEVAARHDHLGIGHTLMHCLRRG